MGKDELVYGESEEPTTLNPLNMTDAVSHRFYKLLYNTLISTDINMMPIPELLESLEPISISEDGTRYIFKLKEGVKWHDGKELTAEDIVFTVNIIKSPKTDSNVKVVHEFSQVKAIDKYKLEIRTKWKLPKERLLDCLPFLLFLSIYSMRIKNISQLMMNLAGQQL
jgi:peptide/nickel transport system substrate-binding protein